MCGPNTEAARVLRRLLKRSSNECYRLFACRERGVIVADRAADRQTSPANGYGFYTNARLAIPRKVDAMEVARATIPVDKMPAVGAYPASCATNLVVGLECGVDHIRLVSGRVIGRLEVGWLRDVNER